VTQLATLAIEDVKEVIVARVEGEIDLSNADGLCHQIAEAVPNQALGLVMDFSRVGYLDSAGIRLLFDMVRRLDRRQQRLATVVSPGSHVREILEMAGAQDHLTLSDSKEEALERVRE
jgi:stage II sporulation protein AA (anti-sigma F factor antagonist)